MKCDGCGQGIVKAPTRCSRCGSSIADGARYRFERVRGSCEPQHVDCEQKQASLL